MNRPCAPFSRRTIRRPPDHPLLFRTKKEFSTWQTRSDYTPPKVWAWNKENGGRFANINRPIAGATHEKDLPVGLHPLQLYSLGTPNGVKVTVLLEEFAGPWPYWRRV